jgi:sulfur-carrier protein adenylyltransferase/sulfurtransferase
MTSPRDLLNAAKADIAEVTPEEAQTSLDSSVFLDVREPDEYDQGAIPGAVHLPRGNLEFQVEGRLPDKDAPVVVYCAGASGRPSPPRRWASSATRTSRR